MAVSTVDIERLSQAVHNYLISNLYLPTFRDRIPVS